MPLFQYCHHHDSFKGTEEYKMTQRLLPIVWNRHAIMILAWCTDWVIECGFKMDVWGGYTVAMLFSFFTYLTRCVQLCFILDYSKAKMEKVWESKDCTEGGWGWRTASVWSSWISNSLKGIIVTALLGFTANSTSILQWQAETEARICSATPQHSPKSNIQMTFLFNI